MKAVILFLIKAYQQLLSPLLVYFLGHSCRMTPTCSEYMYQSIQRHGVVSGLKKGIPRFLACRPGGRSGYDPVQ